MAELSDRGIVPWACELMWQLTAVGKGMSCSLSLDFSAWPCSLFAAGLTSRGHPVYRMRQKICMCLKVRFEDADFLCDDYFFNMCNGHKRG